MSNLVAHARRELERNGLFDKDGDYDGAIGPAVMELVETFSKQGHSGFSADAVIYLFHEVARFKPLGDVTSDPDEWVHVATTDTEEVWQNNRRGSTFSRDGGKTWYDIDDERLNNGDTCRR